jgi:large repetitive protein
MKQLLFNEQNLNSPEYFFKKFAAIFFLIPFLVACNKVLSISTGSSSSISGEASMFKPGAASGSGAIGSLAVECSTATASIHKINIDGSIDDTRIATAPIDADGKFKIDIDKNSGVNLEGLNVNFVIQAEGCNSTYFRPLTDYRNQNVSGASTLLSLTSDIADPSKKLLSSISRIDIKEAISEINQVSSATSLASLLDVIINTPTLAQKFESITNVQPEKLKETPPTSLEFTAPLQIDEGTSNTYRVVTHHWNSDYQVAYEWSWDGVKVGDTDTYILSTNKNSQGTHKLILKVGSRGAANIFDTSKTFRTETFSIVVANTYPPIAPVLTLTTPVPTSFPIAVRSVVLSIATGNSFSNCSSFSNLAITEETATVPSSFPITCNTASAQSLSYTLTSIGDGAKTLRLWAKDQAGNISSSPSNLILNLDTQAPVATINTTVASLTAATSQSFLFSATDTNTIANFECKIDSGTFANCSSPKSYSSLSSGIHTFSVRAIDGSGNISSVVSASWSIDTTPPAVVISDSPAALNNQLTSQVSFTATDSGGGTVGGFVCKLDSGSYAACTSPYIDLLMPGPHTLQIKAFDSAGNYSSGESVSWTIDTTAPTVSISSYPASITNSQNVSFSFSGTDTGGGSIAGYQCSLDSAAFSTCTSPSHFSSLVEGSHNFSVKTSDTAGNPSTIQTYSWTIDLTTPVPSISSSPAVMTNATTANFAFSSTPPPSGSIAGYDCKLDSGNFISCTSPTSYTSLTQGAHTFQVRSIDNNSNVSSVVNFPWTVDLTAPTTSITASPDAINNSTSVTISFTAVDTGGASIASFECKLDSGSFADCSSPITYSSLAQGSHTMIVHAIDTAGNIGSDQTATWVADLTVPTISISSTPAVLTNSTSGSFSFSGNDTGGGSVALYQCSIDGEPYLTCTSPQSYSLLSENAHIFAVRSVDTAGNTGTAATFNWTVDITPPTLSMSGTPSLFSNSTSATLTFSGTDTGGGSIASYQCSIDSGSFTTCTSPKTYTSLSQATHTFAVRATDTAGNTSGAQSTSWTVDTTPPVVTVTSPSSNGSVIATSSLGTTSFSGACEDGLNVEVSGAVTATRGCSSGSWSASLDLSGLSDGTKSLTFTQTDLAGNSTSVTRTVIKDTVAPVISLSTNPSTNQAGNSTLSVGYSVTEANISTAQVVSVSYSTNNGSTWTALGTMAALNGPLSSQAMTYSLTFPSVNSNQFKFKIDIPDKAGNIGTVSSNAFVVDSSAPTISLFTLNGGSSNTTSSSVPVSITGADNQAVTQFCMKYNTVVAPTTADSCWINLGVAGVTPATSISVSNYYYRIGLAPGTYSVAVYLRDAAGNISALTQTLGQDYGSVNYTPGNPPQVITVSAVSSTNPSTPPSSTDLTIPVNTTAYVEWNVTSSTGIGSNGIEIFYTTDDSIWTSLASGLPNSQGTGCTLHGSSTGCYKWTNGSPTSNFFRIRVKATDTQNYSAQNTAVALNANVFNFLAGNTEGGVGGSANAAVFLNNIQSDNRKSDYNSLAVHPNGTIYFRDATRGILKVDPADGLLKEFIKISTSSVGDGVAVTSATVKNPIAISLDYQNNLLVYDNTIIRKVNLAANPPTISTIIGGTAPLVGSDNIANAKNLGFSTPSKTDVGVTNFHPLPNGDLIFKSDYQGGYDSVLRWYHASDGSISTVHFSGTGAIAQAPSIDVSACGLAGVGPILDSSGNLTGFLGAMLINPTNVRPACAYDLNYNRLNLIFSTNGALIENINSTNIVYEVGQIRLGKDLNLYGFTHGYLKRYDSATKLWVNLNSSSGFCNDDIAFSSCPISVDDFFVDSNSKIYFAENGRVRTVNDSGNVQTIAGQSMFYGDTLAPLQARFRTLSSIGLWNDGTDDRVANLDTGNHRIREFKLSPTSTINTVAGTGTSGSPSLSVPANTTAIRDINSNSTNYLFAVDPTGNIYMTNNSDKIGKLNRSTGYWTNFAGGGSTSYATGDTLTGTDIFFSNGNSMPFVLGASSSEIIVHTSTRNGGSYDNPFLKSFNVVSGVMSTVAGKIATAISAASNWCSTSTSLSSCVVPRADTSPTPRGPAAYDPFDSAWLVSFDTDLTIRKLIPGGAMQTYFTAAGAFRGYALRKEKSGAVVTNETLYYCDTSGTPARIKKVDMLTNTTTSLAWPISSMSCSGFNMIYNSNRNSLIFMYQQNGLEGIAEYLNP